MAPSESQKRASLKWDKENMSVIGCKMRKSQAEKFKAHCEAQGKTPNTVLKDYVLACIGEAPPEAARSPTTAAEAQESIFTPRALEMAQRAAECAGEAIQQFVERAVDSEAKRDRQLLAMGINPAKNQ